MRRFDSFSLFCPLKVLARLLTGKSRKGGLSGIRPVYKGFIRGFPPGFLLSGVIPGYSCPKGVRPWGYSRGNVGNVDKSDKTVDLHFWS